LFSFFLLFFSVSLCFNCVLHMSSSFSCSFFPSFLPPLSPFFLPTSSACSSSPRKLTHQMLDQGKMHSSTCWHFAHVRRERLEYYGHNLCVAAGFIPNYCVPGHVTEPATEPWGDVNFQKSMMNMITLW
jgi:hypothetical protein